MKVLKAFIFLLLLTITGINQLWGEGKRNNLIFSAVMAHYSNVGYTPDFFNGYYFYPVDPGAEVIYMYSISSHIKLGTGVNFQSGRNMSWKRTLLRFHFNELSLPFQLKIDLFCLFNHSMIWFFTPGFDIGKAFGIKVEDTNSFDIWQKKIDLKESYIENYSNDTFFSDLYFDLGFTQSIGRFGKISVAPFVSFRQNTTWMEYHKGRTHYGIKISYPLKF